MSKPSSFRFRIWCSNVIPNSNLSENMNSIELNIESVLNIENCDSVRDRDRTCNSQSRNERQLHSVKKVHVSCDVLRTSRYGNGQFFFQNCRRQGHIQVQYGAGRGGGRTKSTHGHMHVTLFFSFFFFFA
jgi:hypothetical protein